MLGSLSRLRIATVAARHLSRTKTAFQPPSIEDFKQTYELIRELRQDRTAVVDRCGAEALHELAPDGYSDDDKAYHTLISLMLSSQTKDITNAVVMKSLREQGLKVSMVIDTPVEDLQTMIFGVSFHNRKAEYIKRTTEILDRDYEGRVPSSMKELLALPGVGPKMALLALQIIHHRVEGISVDTHVHRVSNALGWANASKPEATRTQLESWVPEEYWPDFNALLVGLGQESQTERTKLVEKCTKCSRPEEAFEILRKLKVPFER